MSTSHARPVHCATDDESDDQGWVTVVRRRGDVEREDAQRFALLAREWAQDWNSERDRSYRLP